LILYAVTQPQSWLATTMRLGWLRWLGSIAYGVYLVHQMVAKFVFRLIWHSSDPHLHSLANAGAMTLALLLTLAVCRLSWTYFEKPLLHLGHRLTTKSAVIPVKPPLMTSVKYTGMLRPLSC
jgi:peptidoglycan/LPS O-acetylase OafA/YrhL